MRLAKAAVYMWDDDVPFNVAETPSEVAELLRNAEPEDLVQLTLGNESDWNGKPLYVRACRINAISPSKTGKAGDGGDLT